jgi:glycosyltransferase involved in cell wall biosynthesis
MVSIIITTYNYSSFIAETIECVKRQLYTDFECIIIDNGSIDNTTDIVQRNIANDKRFRLYSQDNRGVSGARNSGINHAKGEFIQFLDGDDLIEENKIASQVKAFERKPEADIIYGDVAFFDDGNKTVLRKSLKGNKPDNWLPKISGRGEVVLKQIRKFNFLVTHSPLLRNSVIEKAGKFDENIQALEDWDFWMRCAYSGCYFHYDDAPGSLCLVRVRPASLSTRKDLMVGGNFIVLGKRIAEKHGFGDTAYFIAKHAELFWNTAFSKLKVPRMPSALYLMSVLLFPFWAVTSLCRKIKNA